MQTTPPRCSPWSGTYRRASDALGHELPKSDMVAAISAFSSSGNRSQVALLHALDRRADRLVARPLGWFVRKRPIELSGNLLRRPTLADVAPDHRLSAPWLAVARTNASCESSFAIFRGANRAPAGVVNGSRDPYMLEMTSSKQSVDHSSSSDSVGLQRWETDGGATAAAANELSEAQVLLSEEEAHVLSIASEPPCSRNRMAYRHPFSASCTSIPSTSLHLAKSFD